MKFFNKKNIFTGFLMISLVFTFSFSPALFKTKKTEAFWGIGDVCSVPKNTAETIVQTGMKAKDMAENVAQTALESASAASDAALETKEYVLDPLVALAKEALIQQVTKSIVDWINSGFKGGPSFVQDFGGTMEEVANEAAGKFIEESDFSFLCNSFDVKLALGLSRSEYKNEYDCTLDDVVGNVDDFINDFSQGGISGFLELTTETNNNPYSQVLGAQAELAARMRSAEEEKDKEIAAGKGFLSKKECEMVPKEGEGEGEGDDLEEHCTITTPGDVTNSQLNDWLGSSLGQLEVADEIDEIVSALGAQLAQKAMQSLKGMTEEDDNGDTYFSKVDEKRQRREEESKNKIKDKMKNDRGKEKRMTDNEKEYKGHKEDSRSHVVSAKLAWEDVETCYDDKINVLNDDAVKDRARQRRDVVRDILGEDNDTLDKDIKSLKSSLDTAIDESEQNIIELENFYDNHEDEIDNTEDTTDLRDLAREEGIDEENYNVAREDVREAREEKGKIEKRLIELSVKGGSNADEDVHKEREEFKNSGETMRNLEEKKGGGYAEEDVRKAGEGFKNTGKNIRNLEKKEWDHADEELQFCQNMSDTPD